MSRVQEQKTLETPSTIGTRSIARQLAREIREEELEIAGAALAHTTCSCCVPDDCGC